MSVPSSVNGLIVFPRAGRTLGAVADSLLYGATLAAVAAALNIWQ